MYRGKKGYREGTAERWGTAAATGTAVFTSTAATRGATRRVKVKCRTLARYSGSINKAYCIIKTAYVSAAIIFST